MEAFQQHLHKLQIIVLSLVAAVSVSSLPTVPAGGSFRAETRGAIIHKSKREANPSVQSAYSYGNGGSYAQLSQVNCLPGDPCELPTIPTRPDGGPFRYEFRHHAKAN